MAGVWVYGTGVGAVGVERSAQEERRGTEEREGHSRGGPDEWTGNPGVSVGGSEGVRESGLGGDDTGFGPDSNVNRLLDPFRHRPCRPSTVVPVKRYDSSGPL